MSVLIRGMKMPENCVSCPMCKEDDLGYIFSYCTGECKDIPNMGLTEPPRWCPLAGLPETHGDLIDKHEFLKSMNIAIAMMKGSMKIEGAENDEFMQGELKAYRDIRDGVKELDVVIKAEGDEE